MGASAKLAGKRETGGAGISRRGANTLDRDKEKGGNTVELLKTFPTPGIPGREERIRAVVKEELRSWPMK